MAVEMEKKKKKKKDEYALSLVIKTFPIQGYLSGKSTPNRNWASFLRYLKFVTNFGKNNVSILKQIVWETQIWHYIFSRLSSSWVIDQNNILHILNI